MGFVHENELALTLISEDRDDDYWQLELRASNGRVTVKQELYAYREHFEPFADALQRFGTRPSDTAILEIGKDSDNWAYFIRLRVFFYSLSGNAAIQVIAKNRSAEPYGQSAEFFLRTEVATLNRLGKELVRWLNEPWSSFSWQERG